MEMTAFYLSTVIMDTLEKPLSQAILVWENCYPIILEVDIMQLEQMRRKRNLTLKSI